ncbi:MAG: RNA 3'-terminal phosphate cyclase [Sedimentisphaerales bacterium]|nr:RNA 3'-terminal phosphate cyclase [Sedimentisphaerales bacterium]
MDTIFIDGSTGEGGGQILRTALSLSCITGKSLHIENIRDARRNQGLAKQHISCVQAACQICNGKSRGAVQRSQVLDFQPGSVQNGDFFFDIGSAGSASLVAQTVLPALFLTDKPSTVTVNGGTHNPLAPPFDFLSETFLPAVITADFLGTCKLVKHGFFPAGGGKIIFNTQPRPKNSQKIISFCEPTDKPQISARIYTAKLPENIARKQHDLLLQSNLDFKNIEHVEVTDSDGPGNCVMLRLCSTNHTTVFTAFGQRGKPSHKVISEVVGLAKDFLDSGAAVDRFLADQLLIYMAITKAGCFITNEITAHLTTNMDTIKKFLDVDFSIDKQEKLCKISCRTQSKDSR